jgi:hypothetical protein
VRAVFPHEVRAQRGDNAGEQRTGQQAKDDHLEPVAILEPIDQHVDADVDAGAHAVRRAELGHPHEHEDAQLLCPRQVPGHEPAEDTARYGSQPNEALRRRPARKIGG